MTDRSQPDPRNVSIYNENVHYDTALSPSFGRHCLSDHFFSCCARGQPFPCMNTLVPNYRSDGALSAWFQFICFPTSYFQTETIIQDGHRVQPYTMPVGDSVSATPEILYTLVCCSTRTTAFQIVPLFDFPEPTSMVSKCSRKSQAVRLDCVPPGNCTLQTPQRRADKYCSLFKHRK